MGDCRRGAASAPCCRWTLATWRWARPAGSAPTRPRRGARLGRRRQAADVGGAPRDGGRRLVAAGTARRRPQAAAFSFALPPCPVNQLTLDLPLDLVPFGQPRHRGGIPSGRRGTAPLGDRAGGPQPLPAPHRAGGAAAEPRRLALARQSMVYDLSRRGVEVSSQLKLEAHEEPLRQVTLLMDPQLQLVTALRGDAAAPWSVVSPPGSPLSEVVVTLPARDSRRHGGVAAAGAGPAGGRRALAAAADLSGRHVLAGGRGHAAGSGAAVGRAAHAGRLPAIGGRSAVGGGGGRIGAVRILRPRRHRGAGAGPAPLPCRSSAPRPPSWEAARSPPAWPPTSTPATPRSSRWRPAWPPPGPSIPSNPRRPTPWTIGVSTGPTTPPR